MPVAHRQEIPLRVRAVVAPFWEREPDVVDGLHVVSGEGDRLETYREGDEEWLAVFRFHLLRLAVHQIIDPKNHYPDPVVLPCYDLL